MNDKPRTVNQIIAAPPNERRFSQAEFDAARLAEMDQLDAAAAEDEDDE